ncbi:hypothetical protein [Leifsonia sp. SIMBA_070]|uniref:hypothetical protein n=1 Tax=Leifsonia sp. SIMBA_070 TaxID=3085810 RepID=UPI0039790EF5
MFGRRRHAAAEPAAPVPQLTDAQILELVHTKVAELIGENGEWTVVRRANDDTDTIFHSILAQSVSVGIAAAIAEARRRLEAGESLSEPQHLAPAVTDEPVAVAVAVDTEVAPTATQVDADAPHTVVEAPVAEAEPAAFSWEPAPITQWTDLRKPVTGEFPLVSHRTAA